MERLRRWFLKEITVLWNYLCGRNYYTPEEAKKILMEYAKLAEQNAPKKKLDAYFRRHFPIV